MPKAKNATKHFFIMVTFSHFLPFGPIWLLFAIFWLFLVIFGHFGQLVAIFGNFGYFGAFFGHFFAMFDLFFLARFGHCLLLLAAVGAAGSLWQL